MRVGQTSFTFFISKFSSSAAGFLATIYLARVLGSEVLGIYFLSLAVIIWMQLITTMGISKAIIKKISEGNDIQQYVAAGLILEVGIALLLSIIAFILRGYIEQYVGASIIALIILMFFSNIFFAFIGSILKGSSRVHIFSITDVTKQVSRSVLQVVIVFAGFGIAGLIIGHVIGTVLAAFLGLSVIAIGLHKPEKKHLLEIISFAKFAWITDFETKSFSWMDTVILGFFVSASLIGIYGITWNVASFLALFSTAISQTLFPEISKASSENDFETVTNYLEKSIAYCGLFLIPGFVGSLLVGEQILRIYGEEFTRGSHLLVIFILAQLFYAYQSQFTNTLVSINRPDLAFQVNGSFIFLNLVLNIILVYLYGWTGAAIGTTVAALIGLLIGYIRLSAEIQIQLPIRMITKEWFASILMGILIYSGIYIVGVILSIKISILLVIVLVGIGAVCYFTTLLALSSEFRQTVSNNIPVQLTRLG